MKGIMALVSVFIGMLALAILIAITVGICELVLYVKNKKHKKWCAWVFDNYPELKVLLNEYHRLLTKYGDTAREVDKLQKVIDKLVEKNKYLPKEHSVDEYIEILKKRYQKLVDICTEQSELSDKARAELEIFWKTNFPNLREDKWIMWWSE